MGWTSYHVDGKIDKKAEVAKNLSCKVLKAVVKGNVWYGACELEDGNVIGAVVLTSIDSKDWYNFAYKIVDETMGPCESECPDSILDLLSPTDHEWAIQWRQRCRDYNARKKELSRLPFGTTIVCRGKSWEKTSYIGKTKWINWDYHQYIPETTVAREGYSLKGGSANA